MSGGMSILRAPPPTVAAPAAPAEAGEAHATAGRVVAMTDSNRRPPLSAPDCDLSGLAYMPLYGDRLLQSAFMARASAVAFRAAVRLWWAAWRSRPAGSLPSDDRLLADFAGFGRDLRAWRRVREMALHGFVLCSDGRFYHPVLCEEAKAVWAQRAAVQRRKRRERERAAEAVLGPAGGAAAAPTKASGDAEPAAAGAADAIGGRGPGGAAGAGGGAETGRGGGAEAGSGAGAAAPAAASCGHPPVISLPSDCQMPAVLQQNDGQSPAKSHPDLLENQRDTAPRHARVAPLIEGKVREYKDRNSVSAYADTGRPGPAAPDAGAAAGGAEEDPALPPPDIRMQLWREGRSILHRLCGLHQDQAAKRLGRWCRLLRDDHAALLHILREAEVQRPVGDAAAWIEACVQQRTRDVIEAAAARRPAGGSLARGSMARSAPPPPGSGGRLAWMVPTLDPEQLHAAVQGAVGTVRPGDGASGSGAGRVIDGTASPLDDGEGGLEGVPL